MENKKQEQTFNVRSEEFKQNLVGFINNSGLPVAMVYYIFKSVEKDLESTYYGILNSESKVTRIDIDADGNATEEIEDN